MSTDLRTTLNACDNATGFVGDGPTPAVNTTTGQRYQGSGSIESQHSNSDEQMHTTSIGGTRNLAAATVHWLLKDNLVATFANGGVQGVLGDATDLIGYDMAGNNAPGLDLPPFFRAYKLDVSVVVATPGTFNAYSGTEAGLAQTAITRVGIGTLHLAKAVGNVSNIFLDRMSFHLNANYALRINGGTVGTPEGTSDVQGDDITNGWGMVSQPTPNLYQFFASTEWGEPAANADSYFVASGQTWYFIGDNNGGKAVAVGNFKHRLISNATDTQSFVIDSIVLVNTGVRAPFDFSDPNFDLVKLSSCTFNNWGPLTFPAHVAGDKFLASPIFNNCDQIYLDTMAVTNGIFNGTTDANGAILIDTTLQTANQTDLVFNSDGTGHAAEITAVGTYNLSGWEFNGYSTGTDANGGSTGDTNSAIFVNVGAGTVTINITGGLTPSVRSAGATVIINNNVNGTFTGMKDNTELRIYDLSGNELAGIENATAGTVNDRSFSASISGGTDVRIAWVNLNWRVPPNGELFLTWPASDFTFPVTQVIDRTYKN